MNILASDSIHTEEITLGEDGMPISAMQRREGQQHRQPTPAEVLRWLPKDATPEQQDSAIQANIKPSEITWSEQPDTLHLPGQPKGRSWRDVNMPKYYRESYFTGKPFFNPDLFGGRLGVAGDPVPYSIARDNIITALLLGCFILAMLAFAKTKRFIVRQAKNFFRPPVSQNMTAVTETSSEFRFQFFLVLQSCLLFSLVYFFYVQTQGVRTFLIDQIQVIGVYVAVMLVYVLVKTAAFSMAGWVFFDRRRNEEWLKSFLFLLAMEGVCVFPIVMLQAYFEMPVQTTLICTMAVLVVFKILALYKSYLIFFRHSGNTLQIFLYFCTLEAMPLVALTGVLDILTGFLKVSA